VGVAVAVVQLNCVDGGILAEYRSWSEKENDTFDTSEKIRYL
jgi:hypothetical protein